MMGAYNPLKRNTLGAQKLIYIIVRKTHMRDPDHHFKFFRAHKVIGTLALPCQIRPESNFLTQRL
jgi:hypothetical protein